MHNFLDELNRRYEIMFFQKAEVPGEAWMGFEWRSHTLDLQNKVRIPSHKSVPDSIQVHIPDVFCKLNYTFFESKLWWSFSKPNHLLMSKQNQMIDFCA